MSPLAQSDAHPDLVDHKTDVKRRGPAIAVPLATDHEQTTTRARDAGANHRDAAASRGLRRCRGKCIAWVART